MKFKVDENLPQTVVTQLRLAGHDAFSVEEQGLRGSNDSTLADKIREEGRALITIDLDFSDVRFYPPAAYAGIVVLRLKNYSKPHVTNVMRRLVGAFDREELVGNLWIVEEHQIRIRC